MILKHLKMENFRSYVKEDIELPAGTNLFEGDIGSGKSSVLYAIEFALFGLGDMKGESLLKAGQSKGYVELAFDIDGKDYVVRRSLTRKGDSIGQNEGYIISGGKKSELSPTDLRAAVLEILNFNENLRARSSSVIFRYAIFTPQEEMKEILRLKPEDRLQTLRKAFGLEDYKTAKDNAKLVTDEIRSRVRYIEGEISDLNSLAAQKDENTKSLESFGSRLDSLSIKKAETENRLFVIEENIRKLEGQRISAEKLSSELPLLENELRGKKRDLSYAMGETESITKEMEAYEKKIDELLKTESAGGTKEDIARDMEALKKGIDTKTESMVEIRTKIKDARELLEKKICPTCKRKIEEHEYKESLSHSTAEYDELVLQISTMKENLDDLQLSMKKLEEHERSQAEARRMTAELDKLRERLSRNSEKIRELGARILVLEEEIPVKIKAAGEGKAVIDKISGLESQKREADDKLKSIISEASALGARIKALSDSNERLDKQISEKTAQKIKKESLGQYYAWLMEYFIPCIDMIEKQVLASINSEFNALFQKWFTMLLEGCEFNVRVDESFTPIVEQNGYEMSIDSLSGGEKTSVAFSYRLALNVMVRKVTTSMKSNLLILDEPTDGFSKEQLFKVRDVLNELKSDQVILVSHEKELESFVDKIFIVEKKGGVSRIVEK